MSGYIDLHCHVLHGVDDGPDSLEVAAQLVEGLASLGFSEIYPTPHQKPGSWTPSPRQCAEAAAQLRDAIDGTGAPPIIHPAAGENMFRDQLLDPCRSDAAMYPGDKAFLMEFLPLGLPAGLRDRFYELRMAGKLPVLAHIERYPQLIQSRDRLEGVAQNAALLVNLGSLGGWWTSRDVRRLVREGWVHAAASDAHSPSDIDACRRGIAWIKGNLGEEEADRLLHHNPRLILAGELPGR